jgi:hypothetical protein
MAQEAGLLSGAAQQHTGPIAAAGDGSFITELSPCLIRAMGFKSPIISGQKRS